MTSVIAGGTIASQGAVGAGARREANYAALLELLPLPACLVNDEGAYLARGRSWLAPGHTPLDYGAKWPWLVSLADRRDVAVSWSRAVAWGEDFNERCRLVAPGAIQGRWYAVSAARLDDISPGIWLVTATDIHAIKENEARMTEFLAFLAHELQSPLTTISGNVHILNHRASLVPSDMRQTALDDVEIETKRLLRLTTGLLKIARMQSVASPVSPVDLDTLLGELAARHHHVHPSRTVEVSDAANIYVFAIQDFLEEIIGNYLANAEKYSPEPSAPIEITVRTYPRAIEVAVLDRGLGIGGEEVDDLFLPFVRGHSTSQTSGSGIGLAICKRLAELQGGSIWAGPREGGGSEFGIRLARAQPDD